MSATTTASVRSDARKNCKAEFGHLGNKNAINMCVRRETEANKVLRNMYHRGWRKTVQQCYHDNPGKVRGIQRYNALRCWERRSKEIKRQRKLRKGS